jgi:hypothetical protein
MPIQKSFRKTRYVLYKETLVDFKENFGLFLAPLQELELLHAI